jgi:RNA polymerase sigma factor (sigma-70 family)
MSSARVSAVLRHIRTLAAAKDHHLPDDQLLDRFAAHRDEAAFATLLARHGPMVLSVCRSILHDLHDAEDAFQAAFLLLAQKAGSLRRRQAVSAWLYRVAYHLAVRARADAARRRALDKKALTTPPADPLLDLNWREVQTILFEELERLPEHYRAPLVLCGLEEKSLEEAAHLLGQSRGTVKGRLQRGRALLRAGMRRRGLELPAALFATTLGLNSASGVSATLAGSTLRAAVKGAAGGRVAALVQGAGTTMSFSKARIATALVLVVSVAVTACGVLRHPGAPADQPAAQQSEAEKPKPPQKQPRSGARAKPAAEGTIEVRGRVLNSAGKPVAGARLYLAPATPTGPAPTRQATTGPDGRFRFAVSRSALVSGSAEQSAQVLAVAAGHGCDWVKVGPVGQELTLRLVEDVSICGRIFDADGRPVAGARLEVMGVSAARGEDLGDYLAAIRKGNGYAFARYWDGPLPGQPAVLTTSPDGRFRLAGAGRERVVAFRLTGPGIASTGLDVMTRTADSVTNPRGWTCVYGASSDYVARTSRPIRGVVRARETGKPLAGVWVGAPGSSWGNAVTDRKGRYQLLGWAKTADYSLLAKPADGLHFQRLVQLHDTPGLGLLSCDIELVRGLMVRGRVTDRGTGKPVAGARVDYHPLGGNSYVDKLLAGSWDPRSETTTGPDGSYVLTVLPGPGVLGVTAPKWEAYMPAGVTLRERKEFFKTPLVDDRHEDFLTWYAGGGSYGGISQDFYNALVLLEPGEKEKALVRNVALEVPRQLQGRVVGPDDRPLAGVRVCGLVRFGVDTLKGNQFTVRGLNPRANRPLVFYHKARNLGFYVKDLRSAPAGLLTVKLQPCGSASGRVVDPDGQPVAGLRLLVQGRALHVMSEAGGGQQQVTTDRAGRFRAEGLVPGQEYAVEELGDRPSFPRVYAPVVVESGKHKDIGDIKREERRE